MGERDREKMRDMAVPTAVGFDIHGVVDSDYAFFGRLIRSLRAMGVTVYLLTGSRRSRCLRRHLSDRGIPRTVRILSVYDTIMSSYFVHKMRPTRNNYVWARPTAYCPERQVKMDDREFGRVKSDLCITHHIALLVDDSDRYLQHMCTPYFKWRNRPGDRRALLHRLADVID